MKEMSPALEKFCREQELMRVAFTNGRGYPRAVPVWFAALDGDYYFGTGVTSAKWKAIERDPRVGWVIDGGSKESYKGASFSGKAEAVRDEGERARIYQALGVKYFGSPDHPEFVKIFGRVDDAETVYLRLKAEDGLFWEY
jgi:nitroimidazol reductase NimA-like FMN-containing flavoprotein (pyridoxamine 5'-phosphate oxidase superfamily)